MERLAASPSFVGIDVSKDRLDVGVRPLGQAFAVPRDGKGLDQLVTDLRSLAPALIVLEATGGFEITVAAALASAGLPLAVVNPRQIRDFARATGRLAKTDVLDAQVIALFAERIRPEPRPLADADSQSLTELIARRRQVVELIGMETNRLHKARNSRVQRMLRTTLKTLKAQLAELDHDIDDTIKRSPIWRAADDLLTSVPGVGDVTAHTLIGDLPELALGSLQNRRGIEPSGSGGAWPCASRTWNHLVRLCSGEYTAGYADVGAVMVGPKCETFLLRRPRRSNYSPRWERRGIGPR
jgi:transposase